MCAIKRLCVMGNEMAFASAASSEISSGSGRTLLLNLYWIFFCCRKEMASLGLLLLCAIALVLFCFFILKTPVFIPVSLRDKATSSLSSLPLISQHAFFSPSFFHRLFLCPSPDKTEKKEEVQKVKRMGRGGRGGHSRHNKQEEGESKVEGRKSPLCPPIPPLPQRTKHTFHLPFPSTRSGVDPQTHSISFFFASRACGGKAKKEKRSKNRNIR